MRWQISLHVLCGPVDNLVALPVAGVDVSVGEGVIQEKVQAEDAHVAVLPGHFHIARRHLNLEKNIFFTFSSIFSTFSHINILGIEVLGDVPQLYDTFVKSKALWTSAVVPQPDEWVVVGEPLIVCQL